MFHTFSGTAGATETEVFFDGQALTAPHQAAKRIRVRNTDGADTLQVSFDQRVGWIDVGPGTEKFWEAPGGAVIANSRQSFWHRRKAGSDDTTFEGDCVTDPNRTR